MSQLTLELPDATYQSIVATAAKLGMTAEQWSAQQLRVMAMSPDEKRAAKDKILKYAGSCRAVGDLSNEAIDRDLATEYAATREAS